jgi:hypothetical protein
MTCSCTTSCSCSTDAIIVRAGQGGARGAQGVQGLQGATGAGTQGAQGPTGTGTQGVQGLQGPTGGGGITLQQLQDAISGVSLDSTDDLTEGITNLYFTAARVSYIHTQGVANTTWNITHNLNFHPNVTVQDSAGNIVEGEIAFTNTVSLILSFSSPISGSAYLS